MFELWEHNPTESRCIVKRTLAEVLPEYHDMQPGEIRQVGNEKPDGTVYDICRTS